MATSDKVRKAIRNRKNGGFNFDELEQTIGQIDVTASQRRSAMERFFKLYVEAKIKELEGRIMDELEEYVGQTAEYLVKNRLKGEKGDPGIQGEPGQSIKGDKGDAGPQGGKGERGEMGVPGKPGKDGKDGKDGLDGPAGMDGDSVTFEEVMETLRPDFEQFMNQTKKEIKQLAAQKVKGAGGGGGGMSNPTTFSFTGDGSTTSFTLSNNVAANGLAIWAYVNGQWIQPTVHFNVSGTTLTTTFTPANGDIIEGFFLRT